MKKIFSIFCALLFLVNFKSAESVNAKITNDLDLSNQKYDYLIVGSGLSGAVFANEATKKGKKCLVIDKRNHIGGNIYTENIEGINVHKYGAHIFHTSSKRVWDYINQFAEFNNFVNSPVAVYKDELYNLPFNMNTFSKMWGIKTPEEAINIINSQVRESKIENPKNFKLCCKSVPSN